MLAVSAGTGGLSGCCAALLLLQLPLSLPRRLGWKPQEYSLTHCSASYPRACVKAALATGGTPFPLVPASRERCSQSCSACLCPLNLHCFFGFTLPLDASCRCSASTHPLASYQYRFETNQPISLHCAVASPSPRACCRSAILLASTRSWRASLTLRLSTLTVGAQMHRVRGLLLGKPQHCWLAMAGGGRLAAAEVQCPRPHAPFIWFEPRSCVNTTC